MESYLDTGCRNRNSPQTYAKVAWIKTAFTCCQYVLSRHAS